NVFPEQIKEGLRPWNPYKEYARAPFFRRVDGVQNYISGKFETGPVSVNVEIPTGTYSPANGLSEQQISRTGLGFQKSQNGGGNVPEAGPADSPYHRFGSRIAAADHEKTFFDGIDISLEGIATLAGDQEHTFLTEGLNKINGLVEQAMHQYSAGDPGSIAPDLADGLAATDKLIGEVKSSSLSDEAKYDILHELNVKHTQFNDALALALGLSVTANVTQEHPPTGPFARFMGSQPTFQMAIPGQHFPVLVHVADSGTFPVNVDNISLQLDGANSSGIHAEGDISGPLAADNIMNARFGVDLPDDVGYTRPYFDRPSIDQAYYDVRDPKYRNLPLAPYPLQAQVTASYKGVQINLSQDVQTIEREAGLGTVYHPMPIGPAISLTMVEVAGVIPLDMPSIPVSVKIHSNVKGPAQGSVHLEMPPGWRSEPERAPFSFAQDGQEQIVSFNVFPAKIQEKAYQLKAVADYNNHEYKEGYVQIGYPGLRPYFDYSDANYQLSGANIKVASNLQIGYIEGSGDDIPASLVDLGIHVHFLTANDLASGDLQKYDEILVGVRAYAVREDLRTYNERLMQYVKNGGAVVVQYQTPEFDHNFGPYPYSMTSNPEEVTDEHSVVTILDADNAAMKWPNAISQKDFDGWIEERGSKFLKTWDPHYEALLETHDPGQDPQKGGMVIAHYGSGVYMYTAYAFYRQLPLGVPGAYRIFANLLSLSKNSLLKTQAAQ
ncbi:MAG: PIG-L family deacetylase, partial [Terracidiphilus sp.]